MTVFAPFTGRIHCTKRESTAQPTDVQDFTFAHSILAYLRPNVRLRRTTPLQSVNENQKESISPVLPCTLTSASANVCIILKNVLPAMRRASFCRHVSAFHHNLLSLGRKQEIDERLDYGGAVGSIIIVKLADYGIDVASPCVHVGIDKVLAVI